MKYAFFLLLSILNACNSPNFDSKDVSPRFNHIMLYVSDLDTSIDFYSSAFDLSLINKLDTLDVKQQDGTYMSNPVKMAFMKFPGQDFILELAEITPEAVSNLHFQHLGIDVVDIELSLKKAIQFGAVSNRPINTVRAEDIIAKNTFLDGPDGESIELMQILEGEF